MARHARPMSKLEIWGIFMAAVIVVASATGIYLFVVVPKQPSQPIGPGPTLPGTCAWGGTFPNCNPAPPGQLYYGSVTMAAYGVQANAPSTALTLTNVNYGLYHADKTLEKSLADTSTGVSVSLLKTDNGIMYLSVLDLTQTVGFVDPALTAEYNKPYIGSWTVAQDIDLDSKKTADIVFTLDLSSLANTANAAPTVSIKMYSWKSDTGISLNANAGAAGAPTGLTTAGTYSASGYISFTGVAYEAKVQRIIVWVSHTNGANTTASSLSTLITSSQFGVSEFQLTGAGTYTDLTGVKVTRSMAYDWGGLGNNYDATNTRYVVWTAGYPPVWQSNMSPSPTIGTSGLAQPDQSQTEWGIPLVYMSNAQGAADIGFKVTFATLTGGLTASSVYYLTIEFIITNPAGSTSSKTVKLTLTG